MREGTGAYNANTFAREIQNTCTGRAGCCIGVYVHERYKIKLMYVFGIRVCIGTRGRAFPGTGSASWSITESTDAANTGAGIELSETAEKRGSEVLRDQRWERAVLLV